MSLSTRKQVAALILQYYAGALNPVQLYHQVSVLYPKEFDYV